MLLSVAFLKKKVCESTIHVAFYHNRNCMLSIIIPALPKNSNNFAPLAKAGRLLELTIRRNFKHGEENTGRLRGKTRNSVQ